MYERNGTSLTRRELRRFIAASVYWAIGGLLPWSPRPGGRAGKLFRAYLASHMLDSAGVAINIEKNAWFGSGRGIKVGDRSSLGLDALIMGPLQVGADVMMGPRCIIVAGSHATDRLDIPMSQQGFISDRPVIIEDDVWIGAGVTILPGRIVGRGSIIGAGSVITRDVPAFSVCGGNPARVLRWRQKPVEESIHAE